MAYSNFEDPVAVAAVKALSRNASLRIRSRRDSNGRRRLLSGSLSGSLPALGPSDTAHVTALSRDASSIACSRRDGNCQWRQLAGSMPPVTPYDVASDGLSDSDAEAPSGSLPAAGRFDTPSDVASDGLSDSEAKGLSDTPSDVVSDGLSDSEPDALWQTISVEIYARVLPVPNITVSDLWEQLAPRLQNLTAGMVCNWTSRSRTRRSKRWCLVGSFRWSLRTSYLATMPPSTESRVQSTRACAFKPHMHALV